MKSASVLMLVIAAVLAAPAIHADQTPSLALEPAPAGDRAFAVERAAVSGHLLPSARLVLDYASEPLVLTNVEQEADSVVSDQLWFHALGSLSLAHRFRFGIDVPAVLFESGKPPPATGATAARPTGGVNLADIRLGARAVLFGSRHDAEARFDVAITSSLWIPTATGDYGGDGSVRARGGLIVDGTSRRLFWALNGGVRTRPSEELPGYLPTYVATSLAFGAAGGFFADSKRNLSIGTELVSDVAVGGRARSFDPRGTVLSFLLTGHYRVADGPFEVGAAFGPGIGQGAGSASWRSLLIVGYAPEQALPPPDLDEDGVPDKADACLKVAGVPSRDPLLNGCPEPPSDHDGDAIPDDYDACPMVAGEPTGSRATHGCPKTVDTPKPEPAPPKTELVEKQIVLSQQVQFETGTAILRHESDTVLGEIAEVMSKHPEIELVEVQGHTDETGTAEFNRRLGKERAESVVAWLTAHGVAANRVVAKGYGSDRPISDNTTDEGRAKNRRVEFRVLKTRSQVPERPAPPSGGKP